MKLLTHLFFVSLCLIAFSSISPLSARTPQDTAQQSTTVTQSPSGEDTLTHSHDSSGTHDHSDEHTEEAPLYQHDGDSHAEAHEQPALWSVIPFVILLILIATGPVFFSHFWHKNYKYIAPALGLITLVYYLIELPHAHEPAHALSEYISFIALLAPLYIASGGILIQIDRKGTPLVNLILLLFGALISNVIGTTGASMLLIRPFIRLNRDRLQAYHIIFFIFMVSNIGGSLTPIGDPPLFLGFLKGVPFEWTFVHVIPEWLFALVLLGAAFFVVDRRNKQDLDKVESVYSNRIVLRGTKSFIWLAVIVGAVFLDPNVVDWVPAIEYHGSKYSFLREIIQLSAGAGSYFFADKSALRGNEFTFEPINEVIFLFAGIFFAMMPALQLIGEFAASPAGRSFFSVDAIYWATGGLSGFLDNAPTYLNFLSAALAKFDMSVSQLEDVRAFAAGSVYPETKDYLRAISVSAVFFGAFTYIGNGPNFMVKSIAEERGVEMPSFFGYIVKYSLVILLPVLFLTWLIFF
ncbi:MAG: sodium:proton antiporter [Bacteroidota bacterium]